MRNAALATLSRPHVSPAVGPPSLNLKGLPGAKQRIAKALPKARKRAGLGFVAKGLEAAKPCAAAGSRGQQQISGGAGQARIATKAPAAKSKPSTKAAPGKAAAVSGSLLGQASAGGAVESRGEQGQQQVEEHGEKCRPWLLSSHLVQFIPGKIIAPSPRSQHCNQLDLPSSIMQVWYPDLQPYSSLHLHIKVPPAAAAGQNAPHCSPRSQGTPEQEDAMGVSSSHKALTGALPTPAHGTGVESAIDSKQVQDVVVKRGPRRDACRLNALQQALVPYLRWKLVLLEKVGL